MTEPTTEAGRRLLEREAYNSRSFALITAEAILAIESEARAQGALHEALIREGEDEARATAPAGLDVAWAEAEAALPEGLDERALSVWFDTRQPRGWRAMAIDRFSLMRPMPLTIKGMTSPAAALRALAARLAASGETEQDR